MMQLKGYLQGRFRRAILVGFIGASVLVWLPVLEVMNRPLTFWGPPPASGTDQELIDQFSGGRALRKNQLLRHATIRAVELEVAIVTIAGVAWVLVGRPGRLDA